MPALNVAWGVIVFYAADSELNEQVLQQYVYTILPSICIYKRAIFVSTEIS